MTYPAVPPRPHQLTVDSSNSINTDQEVWLPMTDQNIFGQGMVDITGNGHHASIVDTSVTDQGSFIDSTKGACYYTDAPNQTDQAGLITGELGIPLTTSGGFTASIWAHPTKDNQSSMLWASMNYSSGTGQNFQCYRDSVAGRFTGMKKFSAKNFAYATNLTGSPKDSWYHVVTRLDTSGWTLWVDGTNVATSTNTACPSLDQSGDTLTIGRTGPDGQSQSGSGTMYGYLQNFRMWSRNLSDSEIGDLFSDPWVGSSYTATSSGGGTATTSYFKPIRWNKSEDGLNIRRL